MRRWLGRGGARGGRAAGRRAGGRTVSSRRHDLAVVMLVHICVDGLVMERAMEGRVEGVVDDEKERQGRARVRHRQLSQAPRHELTARHVLEVMEGHHHDRDLTARDELAVAPRQLVERLAPRRQFRPGCKHLRHAVSVKLQADLREHAEDGELQHSPVEGVHHAVASARNDKRHHTVEHDVAHDGADSHTSREPTSGSAGRRRRRPESVLLPLAMQRIDRRCTCTLWRSLQTVGQVCW